MKYFIGAAACMAASFGFALVFGWTDAHRDLWWSNVAGLFGIVLSLFAFFGSIAILIAYAHRKVMA